MEYPPSCRARTKVIAGLAEQIKAAAENMAGAGRPLWMADLEAHCSGRGRRRGPVIAEAVIALGAYARGERGGIGLGGILTSTWHRLAQAVHGFESRTDEEVAKTQSAS